MYFLTKEWTAQEQVFVEECRLAGLGMTVLGHEDTIFDLFFKDSKTLAPLRLTDLPLPDYWEITPTGHILDGDQIRGRVVIYEDSPMALCWVEWYNRSQRMVARDRYDLAGRRFVEEIYVEGVMVQSIYYGADGKEQLYLFQEHDRAIRIDEEGQERGFASIAEAEDAYRQLLLGTEEQFLLVDPALLETLSADLVARSFLCLQEDVPEEVLLPLLDQTRGVLTRNLAYKEQYVAQDKLFYLPAFLGSKKAFRPEILILTHTQDLEQIEVLVQGLPDFTFHIAAVTEMGESLTRLLDYEQVQLYPCILKGELDALLARCSVYLDIAYSIELLDANRLALRQGLLLYAFKETCHQPQLYPATHLYPKEAVQELIQSLRRLEDPDEAAQAYEQAGLPGTVADPQAFREILLALTHSSPN